MEAKKVTSITELKARLRNAIIALSGVECDLREGMFEDCLEGNLAVMSTVSRDLDDLIESSWDLLEEPPLLTVDLKPGDVP